MSSWIYIYKYIYFIGHKELHLFGNLDKYNFIDVF
jgi:hypothetical protein